MARVYAHFDRNLRDIVKAAETPVILSTVASNLEGCPPFASPEAQEQFRLGNFEKARDLDTLRFRADSRINEIIRNAARDFGTGLVDPATQTRSEHFHEHVHFTFAGNYRVARMLAEETARLLDGATNSWPSQDQCAEWLACTEWDQFQIIDEIVKRLQLPPFTGQSGHAERIQRFRDARARLEAALKPENHDRWIQTYRAALAKAPNDWMLHENFATLLQNIGDASGAEREWRKVTELLPHSAAAWYGLGNVLDALGKSGEALECFRKALSLKPGAVEARNGLGLALASQGKTSEAIHEYQTALRQKPDFAEARVNLGLALAKEGKLADAINEYRAALRANSNSVAARINLGNALAARDDRGALAHYAEAVRLKPDFAQAHYLYGMELSRAGRPGDAIRHLQRAVELQPNLSMAHFNLGVALAKQQRFADAAVAFEAVLRLEPQHATARKYLEQAQARAQR
jgi:tetratricopeptide (TPR) repeat protein